MKADKVLKIVLIVILVLIIIFAIHIIRNYIIFGKIAEKQVELSSINNFSFTFTQSSSEDLSDRRTTELYYKNGKSIKIKEDEDGDKVIIWSDESTNELVYTNPTKLTAFIDTPDFLPASSIPVLMQENSIALKLKASLNYFITYGKINGEECYIVHSFGTRTYISKESGAILISVYGYRIDGRQYYHITEYMNYKFNELTDEDVSRPNLTGYDVNYNE